MTVATQGLCVHQPEPPSSRTAGEALPSDSQPVLVLSGNSGNWREPRVFNRSLVDLSCAGGGPGGAASLTAADPLLPRTSRR